MASKRLFRSALHQHADPAQRVIGAADLPPESDQLAALLTDPAPEVRVAAANRCADLGPLAAAWDSEPDPGVRMALASALATALSEMQDSARATAWLDADPCTDAIRADVARRTEDADRRRSAIAAIREEALLLELALSAEHAETRMAAAERVRTAEGLNKLADAAKKKDRGVARLARKLGKRVFAIVGCATEHAITREIFDGVFVLAQPPITREDSMTRTATLLRERARELGGTFLLS